MLELVLVVLYPVIIGVAIAQFGLGEETEAAHTEATGAEAEAPGSGPASTASELVASGTEWNTAQLAFKPKEPANLEVVNEDPVVHNMSIYPDETAALAKQDALFTGPDVDGGGSVSYEIDPLKPGTYTFICDYHTNMIGEVTVE